MLTLGRRPGESLIFQLPDGRQGTVGVYEIARGSNVRLACNFPADVRIIREELTEQTPAMEKRQSVLDQLVEERAINSRLRRIIEDIEPYVTSQIAMDRIAEAYRLTGIPSSRHLTKAKVCQSCGRRIEFMGGLCSPPPCPWCGFTKKQQEQTEPTDRRNEDQPESTS